MKLETIKQIKPEPKLLVVKEVFRQKAPFWLKKQ
jgi:hypothetical protein